MADDFQSKADPHLRALLAPGEELRGVCAAVQQSTFRGRLYAFAATDRRLILLPMDRKIEPGGEAETILPESIAEAEAEGVSEGWWTPTSGVMDKAAVTLKLRTHDGAKRKLMMMRGGGDGPFGKLAGGPGQAAGVQAIADFFAAQAGP